MIILAFTLFYILVFEVFALNIAFFNIGGILLLALYRLFKHQQVDFFGYLTIFDLKFTKDNWIELLACLIFIGYYFLKINMFGRIDSLITYPSLVMFSYFIGFYSMDHKEA